MFQLKRPFKIFVAILLAAWLTAPALAQDLTARAMKLYEKHLYDEAARLLHPAINSLDEATQPGARLALGMIYLRSAELYFELQRNAVVIQSDYLKKLTLQKGPDASRFADYYLGLVSLEDGKYSDSSRQLQKFIDNADVSNGYKSLAKVDLGLSYWGLKQGGLASAQWNLSAATPLDEKAALAATYAYAGMRERKPADMADQVLTEIKKQGKPVSMLLTQRLVRAFGRSDAIEKALDLLDVSELRAAAYVETLGKSKSISFYDPGLLADMAYVYLRASINYLEQAGQNQKLASTAAFFLADAYLIAGNLELANRYSTSFLSQAQIPTAYLIHARATQAASSYRAGKQQEALTIWGELFDQAAVRPELQAEILNACVVARANCSKFEQRAVAVTEAGEGKKFFPLNAALGKYYLARKNYAKAVLHMEAGRDKANKNKIEVNDPAMLAMLAQAYFYNKKFSESLEIYFEMSKQYPAIRQIQDSLQGIYSIEQKSAGDVKIF
jgi:hypothetical protein